jgi:hypothetical protein
VGEGAAENVAQLKEGGKYVKHIVTFKVPSPVLDCERDRNENSYYNLFGRQKQKERERERLLSYLSCSFFSHPISQVLLVCQIQMSHPQRQPVVATASEPGLVVNKRPTGIAQSKEGFLNTHL